MTNPKKHQKCNNSISRHSIEKWKKKIFLLKALIKTYYMVYSNLILTENTTRDKEILYLFYSLLFIWRL